jgi:hypothetical protein
MMKQRLLAAGDSPVTVIFATSAGLRPALAVLGLLAAGAATSATLSYTYAWQVNTLADSNGNPPPQVTVPLSGTFTATFDIAEPTGQEGPLDAMTPWTNDNGYTFDTTNTGVQILTQTSTSKRITVGGYITGIDGGVGLTDDWRLWFLVDDVTGEVLGPFGSTAFTYSNALPVGGAYNGDLEVSLVSVAPIPLPGGLPLLLGAVGVLAGWRSRGASAKRSVDQPSPGSQ